MKIYNFYGDGSFLGSFYGNNIDEAYGNMMKCFDKEDLRNFYNISIEQCSNEIDDIDSALSLCFSKTFTK